MLATVAYERVDEMQVIVKVPLEDRLVMSDSVSQGAQSFEIIMKFAPNLLDGAIAQIWNDGSQMRIPDRGIEARNEHFLPENEF